METKDNKTYFKQTTRDKDSTRANQFNYVGFRHLSECKVLESRFLYDDHPEARDSDFLELLNLTTKRPSVYGDFSNSEEINLDFCAECKAPISEKADIIIHKGNKFHRKCFTLALEREKKKQRKEKEFNPFSLADFSIEALLN